MASINRVWFFLPIHWTNRKEETTPRDVQARKWEQLMTTKEQKEAADKAQQKINNQFQVRCLSRLFYNNVAITGDKGNLTKHLQSS